ncbi:chemotaxis protein histidine kinase and related kinase [Candidatus Scalindua japonica]|uniref:Chemotaxis protein CheA n=1 Tax=Candidatus Scalindua japonica TaxID=1284222 RepID=A0A286TW00_9BACT|nr:chemotaxis protein CheA [Candidatus Scalindua japonica]GAX60067.1 chemotaxis protein histidine kinase and related kinase [Candidatus Scalindua japonica]
MSNLNTEVQNTDTANDELTLDIKEDSEIFLEFLSEVLDHLDESESNILSIEDEVCDYEKINAIFRSIHSIKGSAGFLGLINMQRLSHELEALLDKARKGEITITQEIINISLNAIDALRKLRDNLSIKVDRELGNISDTEVSTQEQPINIQEFIDRITSILNGDTKPKEMVTESHNTGSVNVLSGHELQENTKQNPEIDNMEPSGDFWSDKLSEQSEKMFLGEILIDEGTITQEQLDKAIDEGNKKIGEILIEDGATTPEKIEKALNEQKPIGQILAEKGDISEPQLDNALKQQEKKVGEILVEKGIATPDKIDSALKTQQAQRSMKLQSRTVKVDTGKLDNLFDLVGELVIANTLICGEMKSVNNNSASKNLSQLTKITKDIQDQVMSMRMVTLKQTFQKMSRLVRDVSQHSGKNVKFHITGEETELDKNVIEEIADPLVHILRNSVDHGIESEEDRLAKGKPKEGSVTLSAFHRGGNIIIEIKDDGKGLQKERILKKAVDKGLVSKQTSMTDNQIYNLIFAPGLSTADKVTNISGRGVGMDVVRKNIEKLRGKVDVTSQEGVGSTFTIKLPLTLAIIDGIVVNVGDTKYIIPTVSIEESLQPKREEISTVKNQGEVVNIRGNLLSLVRLHKLYDINTTKTVPWESIVVVVEGADGKYGVLVDELLGQQQVVIKSLGDRFKNVKGISGSAILGDGKVGLILDVTGVKEAFVGHN